MYLVDTNVLSESTKPVPDERVLEWLETHEPLVRVSVISLGEIHYGIELLTAGRKQSDLRKWLKELRATFADSTLPVDDSVALRWGALKASGDRHGKKMPVIDSLLAATALEHGMTIVTADTGDFIHSGARVLNPFKPAG